MEKSILHDNIQKNAWGALIFLTFHQSQEKIRKNDLILMTHIIRKISLVKI